MEMLERTLIIEVGRSIVWVWPMVMT